MENKRTFVSFFLFLVTYQGATESYKLIINTRCANMCHFHHISSLSNCISKLKLSNFTLYSEKYQIHY